MCVRGGGRCVCVRGGYVCESAFIIRIQEDNCYTGVKGSS